MLVDVAYRRAGGGDGRLARGHREMTALAGGALEREVAAEPLGVGALDREVADQRIRYVVARRADLRLAHIRGDDHAVRGERAGEGTARRRVAVDVELTVAHVEVAVSPGSEAMAEIAVDPVEVVGRQRRAIRRRRAP